MAEWERELDRLHDTMRDGFAGVHTRLDALNDRTRENENDITRLDERVGAGRSAVWGGGFGAAVVALAEAVRWIFGR